VLKFGQEYVDKEMEYNETKYRQQQLQWVAKQAAALNMQLTLQKLNREPCVLP
jgi:hypothetical protein